ncbi:MAG: hypothetical protein M3Q30_06675 [Actinomycetota bacterium]|nr:hypothetical protein [Actinomycetota bacterium]
MVAVIAYYAVVIGVVGPTCFSRAGADPVGRLPVRISLNVAMLTRTTDVATFTTPFPITLGIASDGTFTIPRDRLAFALVDVSVETPGPAFGRFTVRAAATSDFAGTVDTTTGTATLGGSLELLWSRQKPARDAAAPYMLDCPVGPFAVHLSTATVGGTRLARLAHEDPTSRTARLVDDDLDVGAIPDGTKQCAGDESGLNGALSLPIRPKATTTTTSTTVPADSTTSTIPTTTTTATATTDTTDTTTTTTTTTATTTTSTTIAGDASATGPTTDSLGVALDPNVLAFEPSPAVVSTLTIAAGIPPVSSTTTATTRPFASTPRSTPTSVAPSRLGVTRHKPPTVETAKRLPPKRRTNKHAQSDAAAATTTTTTVANARNSAPPLYFSPFNFGAPRKAPPKVLAPGPLFNLGKSALTHHPNALFVALLVTPLVLFALGLVANDLGWRPRLPWRRRRESGAHSRAR